LVLGLRSASSRGKNARPHPGRRRVTLRERRSCGSVRQLGGLAMSDDFEVTGTNDAALFSLKLHRGEGMLLLAMNCKTATPPDDFAGFAIECQEPVGSRFFPLNNRLSFTSGTGTVHPSQRNPTTKSPIQKFRWAHFPRNADKPGRFAYRVTPVFMDA